jgi:anti-sigma factor RsiW
MTDFTPEDLILYLYGETDPLRTARIKAALEKDWALREKLSVLNVSMERLDASATQSPAPSSVEAIMAYARRKSKITH